MQKEYLSQLCANNPGAIIIGSIGTISYDLTDIPHPNKILIRGAMGAALGCGLGYALNTDKQVIVLIGDGAFTMCLSAMATIEKYKPKNLRIIIIDNGKFASCGGQSTNFAAIQDKIPYEIFCEQE